MSNPRRDDVCLTLAVVCFERVPPARTPSPGFWGALLQCGNASCSRPLSLDLFLLSLSLFAKEPDLFRRCSSTPALCGGRRAQQGSPRPPAALSAAVPLCLSSCEVPPARLCHVLVALERGPTRNHGLGAVVSVHSLSSVIPACAVKAWTTTWVRAATRPQPLEVLCLQPLQRLRGPLCLGSHPLLLLNQLLALSSSVFPLSLVPLLCPSALYSPNLVYAW